MTTVADRSLVVYSTLPRELAPLFPAPKLGKLPCHLTLMWVGRFPITSDVFDRACGALRESPALRRPPIGMRLADLSYFSMGRGCVAHVKVVSEDLSEFRRELIDDLAHAGVDLTDDYPIYKPHVTLGWGFSDIPWQGLVPRGSWSMRMISVRHGDKHAQFEVAP